MREICGTKYFVLRVVNSNILQIHRYAESVGERRVKGFFFSALVTGDDGDPRRGIAGDAVPGYSHLTIIKRGAHMMYCIARHALRHGGDHNALIALRQHAHLSDGFSMLKRCAQVGATQ
jgi:hypothetical protein